MRHVLIFQKEEEFVFNNVSERPVPSLLRGYSAPIRLDSDLTESDLYFLLANDSDEFNRFILICPLKNVPFSVELNITIILFFRWEAGQVLARKLMLSLVADFQQQKTLALNPKFVDGLRAILRSTVLDKVILGLIQL
jgi:aminopeptidase N